MDQPHEREPRDDVSLSDQTTVYGNAMERIASRLGRRVDPGLDLDNDDDAAGGETVVGAVSPSNEGEPAAAPGGRYEVGGEIARGGMGAIYKVRDKGLRRSLAMKVILGGSGSDRAPGAPIAPELLHRFLEEAQVTAQLAHPGVVPVHDLGIDGEGRVFFTMGLVRGVTLTEVIEKARAGEDGWTLTRALQVILRVCETMAFAHDKGVIHRDLKPANVMVGKFGQTYVMDWGLAKVLGRDDAHDIRLRDVDASTHSRIETERSDSSDQDSPIMTMDGAVVGTPAYMPPEQAEGRVDLVDKRSDVYAIGTLLYQLLTGQAPYVKRGARMSPHAVLASVVMGPPRAIADFDPAAPAELQAICNKAMSRDRQARYASAAELAEDIQRSLDGRVVRAYETGVLVEARKWIGRNRVAAAIAATAISVLAATILLFLVRVSDADRQLRRTAQHLGATMMQAMESRWLEERPGGERVADGTRTGLRAVAPGAGSTPPVSLTAGAVRVDGERVVVESGTRRGLARGERIEVLATGVKLETPALSTLEFEEGAQVRITDSGGIEIRSGAALAHLRRGDLLTTPSLELAALTASVDVRIDVGATPDAAAIAHARTGALRIRSGRYRVVAGDGDQVRVSQDSGVRSLRVRSSPASKGQSMLLYESDTGVFVAAHVPPDSAILATRVDIDPDQRGLRVQNEVESLRTAKARLESVGPHGLTEAHLGPGAYAVVDLSSGRVGTDWRIVAILIGAGVLLAALFALVRRA